MSRDEAVLLDMALAANRIITFRGSMTLDSFLEDELTQSAILHQLLVLGEASKRMSEDFCAAHPEIPWRLMAGMRDRLIHAYDAVDLLEVWVAAERDVPDLKKKLEPLLPRGRP